MTETRQTKRQKITNQCDLQETSWEPNIKDEICHTHLIKLIIDAEVHYLQDFTESEKEPNQKNILVFSEEYHEQAIRQAGHVYHSLFQGNCNEIIVRQT